ncbi:hypothetical protein ACMAZF_17115 [Psychrobium sp. nBUS_13]|uniref:hypothetical protein n=1 Tax=Psychrobium sp. nBUS_13 TaxID=3395319 RepID=UPI003EB77928
MFKRIIIAAALFPALASANTLLKTTNLDKYCQTNPGDRQTVIYLDQNIIASKDPNWYKDIVNKVDYRPGEKIQFVNINNGGSTVELIWETCHPSFTAEQYKKARANEGMGSIFMGGIDDTLKEDKKFFKKQFMRALAHPLQKTRHEMAPSYSKADFPRKKLVEAIYYDAKRLDIDDVFSRVIVFSDMIENSELFNLTTFDPMEAAKSVAKRYPMFLNYANFQIYGINYTNSETKINENIRDFWKQYLLLSGAYVEQYGAQLAVEEDSKTWQFSKYKGHVTVGNVKGASEFRFVIGDDNKLRHGWLEIADLYLPVTGEIRCSGKNCSIDAEILASSNRDAFRKKDVLRIKGTNSKYKGYVGGKDESVIDAQGNTYQHSISLTQF